MITIMSKPKTPKTATRKPGQGRPKTDTPLERMSTCVSENLAKKIRDYAKKDMRTPSSVIAMILEASFAAKGKP